MPNDSGAPGYDRRMSDIKLPAHTCCANCGYLGARDKLLFATRVIHEVSKEARLTGHMHQVPGTGPRPFHEASPECFVDAQPITSEYYEEFAKQQPDKPAIPPPFAVLAVINKERRCDRHCQFKPGLSPSGHLQEEQRRHQEERDKKWDLKILALHKKIDDQREKERLERESQRSIDRADDANREKRIQRRMDIRDLLIVLLFGIVGIFVPLFLPNGCVDLAAKNEAAVPESIPLTSPDPRR